MFSLEGLSVAGGTCGFLLRESAAVRFVEGFRFPEKLRRVAQGLRGCLFLSYWCINESSSSSLWGACGSQEEPVWGAMGRRLNVAKRKSSFRGWSSVAGNTCDMLRGEDD